MHIVVDTGVNIDKNYSFDIKYLNYRYMDSFFYDNVHVFDASYNEIEKRIQYVYFNHLRVKSKYHNVHYFRYEN